MHRTKINIELTVIALIWVMVAGVCAVLANVIAASLV